MAEYTLDEQLKEVRREIAMRHKVYARSNLDEATLTRRIDLMAAVAETLESLIEDEQIPLAF